MSAPFQKVHFFCLFGKIWIKNPPLSSEMRNSVFCHAFENGRGCGTHTATASFSVPPPGQLGLPACDDAASVSHANL